MDLLNIVENMHHMYRAFGGWTFAFSDYYALNFTARIDDPNMTAMTAIIDPYSYRDRLTMPKLVVDAGGDEFFMLDDNWFWWNDMQGELHLRMVQVCVRVCFAIGCRCHFF
jgi:PhoPQ-activated pathogenicity-related protein